MEIKMAMKTRDGQAYAEAFYLGNKTVVIAGGRVSKVFRGSSSAKAYRDNREFVDEEGNIIKDCVFRSASTAAQFVNGNISNGMRVWKVGNETLGAYLEKNDQK